MKSFDTYMQLSKEIMKKFEKTSNPDLDAEDIIAYATLISDFASIVKNKDNLEVLLQDSINPETGKIEIRSKLTLSLLYRTAAVFSAILDPKANKTILGGYGGDTLKTMQDIAKSEHLIKDDVSTM